MRYRFHTLSAAFYVIDTVAMTWTRHTPQPQTPANILGMTENSGTLTLEPKIEIGQRAILQIGPGLHDYILTTAVQRIELLED